MKSNYCLPFFASLFIALALAAKVEAQNKVVVIPLAGEDTPLPQYRIVPHQDLDSAGNSVANPRLPGPSFGRLEWTPDKTPDGKSIWGKVCDDLIEGNAEQQRDIANFSCRAIGYAGGFYRSSGATTDGPLRTILDNVQCPENATSFEQCSSNALFDENCDGGEDEAIGIDCYANTSLNFDVNDATISCPPPSGGLITGELPFVLEVGPELLKDTDPLPAGANRLQFQFFWTVDAGANPFRYRYRAALQGSGTVASGSTTANSCDGVLESESQPGFMLAGREWVAIPEIISTGSQVTLKSVTVREKPNR